MKWTEADDNYLRKNHGVLSNDEIAKHLGRTKEAIHLHVNKLRLSKRNWSEEEIEYLKEFWQKDICIHWDNVHGCTACESDCDSCTSFRRIPVQYCKRCGKDFFERKSNDFCNDCRRARLKQAQRKYAILNSKKR